MLLGLLQGSELSGKWNNSPKTIFPLIFALSSLAKKHGYNKILERLVANLKKLVQGVTVYYGEEQYLIKATVTECCYFLAIAKYFYKELQLKRI